RGGAHRDVLPECFRHLRRLATRRASPRAASHRAAWIHHLPGKLMKTSLTASTLRAAAAGLERANRAFVKTHPGESGERQPVHTLYGGAHLFTAGIARKLGDKALDLLAAYAATPEQMECAFGAAEVADRGPAGAELWQKVRARVAEKLRREPVEDFRID